MKGGIVKSLKFARSGSIFRSMVQNLFSWSMQEFGQNPLAKSHSRPRPGKRRDALLETTCELQKLNPEI